MPQGRTPGPLVSFAFRANCGVPFFLHAGKGNGASGFRKSRNLSMENRFSGLQMVQFECPKATCPLVSFTFRVNCGVPSFLHAGKGNGASGFRKGRNLSMKNRFCGLQMFQFECPKATHAPWSHLLLESIVGCPFSCLQEKGKVHLASEKVEIYL